MPGWSLVPFSPSYNPYSAICILLSTHEIGDSRGRIYSYTLPRRHSIHWSLDQKSALSHPCSILSLFYYPLIPEFPTLTNVFVPNPRFFILINDFFFTIQYWTLQNSSPVSYSFSYLPRSYSSHGSSSSVTFINCTIPTLFLYYHQVSSTHLLTQVQNNNTLS